MIRDVEALRRYVERFASVLTETGWPRMTARIFIALMVSEDGSATSAELAELLQVSPAAVSGGVRFLIRLNLAGREREPGSRRDLYRVHDDVWVEAVGRREQIMQKWTDSLRDGIAVVGAESPAGRRLAGTLDFFEYLDAEIPKLFEKWKAQRGAAPES